MNYSSFLSARARLAIAGLILAGGLTACGSSTQLVNQWRDPEYPRRPMTNVLVIRMSRNEAGRRLWEDEFVSELARHGVTATPSYRLYPNGLPEDKQVIMDAVRQSSFDGVIMAVTLPTEVRAQYVPGYVSTVPVTRFNPWYDAYVTHFRDVYHPGYTETERVMRQRTEVWSTEAEGRLVWTATSETYDPSSHAAVSHQIAKKIVPELLDQRVIAEEGQASVRSGN